MEDITFTTILNQQYVINHLISEVTHIIATNLPDSKVVADEIVLHPNWILESIQKNQLLPIDNYILHKSTKGIANFFKVDSPKKRVTFSLPEESSSEEQIIPTVYLPSDEELYDKVSKRRKLQ